MNKVFISALISTIVFNISMNAFSWIRIFIFHINESHKFSDETLFLYGLQISIIFSVVLLFVNMLSVYMLRVSITRLSNVHLITASFIIGMLQFLFISFISDEVSSWLIGKLGFLKLFDNFIVYIATLFIGSLIICLSIFKVYSNYVFKNVKNA